MTVFELLQDMAWEKLHTGNWRDVHMAWRNAYALSCLLAATAKLGLSDPGTLVTNAKAAALRDLDMAAMMGGHIFQPQVRELITLIAGSQRPPGQALPEVDNPALETFWTDYMKPQAAVVLLGAISHWPALQRWSRPDYLLSVAGHRTVPVEFGSHYLAADWGQRLMLLSDFMRDHLDSPDGDGKLAGQVHAEVVEGSATSEAGHGRGFSALPGAVAYLAQHPLFDQVPELRADIAEPMYCCLGDGEMQAVNAWLGPAGTVTPLHFDIHHNLLAQVVGRKYVRLYAPAATAQLQPFTEGHDTNASQVDLDAPSEKHRTMLSRLCYKDCILEPGQMLYIPPKHWHYVKALTTSFSVTFWWH